MALQRGDEVEVFRLDRPQCFRRWAQLARDKLVDRGRCTAPGQLPAAAA